MEICGDSNVVRAFASQSDCLIFFLTFAQSITIPPSALIEHLICSMLMRRFQCLVEYFMGIGIMNKANTAVQTWVSLMGSGPQMSLHLSNSSSPFSFVLILTQ